MGDGKIKYWYKEFMLTLNRHMNEQSHYCGAQCEAMFVCLMLSLLLDL